MERLVWKCSWMPLRMEGASKRKHEGYCSHEALCLLLLCENASLSLALWYIFLWRQFIVQYILLIKRKHEKLAKSQCCYGNIMQPGLGGKDLQEKALGKLILMIHTRIECVIQAMPAWHEGFKSMFEFPCCRWLKEPLPKNIWMCFWGKKMSILSYLILKEVNV